MALTCQRQICYLRVLPEVSVNIIEWDIISSAFSHNPEEGGSQQQARNQQERVHSQISTHQDSVQRSFLCLEEEKKY